MDNLIFVILVAVILAIAIGLGKITENSDRQRIREHVEGSGGKVLSIVRQYLWGWRGSRDRAYLVTYKTHDGRSIIASCRTSLFRGVYWIRDSPPGFDLLGSQTEPIDCLECGAKIPAGQTHCPKCGWSYQGE